MGLGVRVGVRLRVSRWSIRGRGSQTTWFASTPRANLCSWPRSNGVCTIVASMAAVAAKAVAEVTAILASPVAVAMRVKI